MRNESKLIKFECMNVKTKCFLVLLLFVGMFLSCEKDKQSPLPGEEKSKAVFNVYPYYGETAVAIDQSLVMSNGWKITFAEIKFLLTDIKLGSNMIASDAFFNFREKGVTFLTIPDMNQSDDVFSTLIGVDSSKNHLDPSTWPSTSALNIANAGDMHWSWNPGYIFIKLEGKVDTIPDGVDLFDHIFSYHIGTDGYTRNLIINKLNWKFSGQNLVADLKLDLKKVLENETAPVDIKKQNSTHSGPEHKLLTATIANNFVSAFSAK